MKIKNKIKSIMLLLLIIMIVCLSATLGRILANSDMSVGTNDSQINLTATSDSENNNVHLNWNVQAPDGRDATDDYIYKVYSKENDDEEFQTVGTHSFDSGEIVKVLNVYPNAGNVLKNWMEDNGYGRGLIEVTPVSISNFNSNPSSYLGTRENWKYDVIFFGTWDSNNGCDINVAARDLTEEFINDGRGVIFGHDTIATSGGNLNHLNFAYLAKYVNMTMGAGWSVDGNGNSKVVITKKGVFTEYPWDIGEIGTVLTIPHAHRLDQTAHGDVWLKFTDREENDFYLTTWNNCAMIQTGHSNANATADEQKIIANLILYTKQTTTASFATDYAGMDVDAPNKIENIDVQYHGDGRVTVTVDEVQDKGTVRTYRVEGANKIDGTTLYSNEETVEIKSGLKGYVYVLDQNQTISEEIVKAQEVVENNVFTFEVPDYTQYYCLHIAAIDNAGNVSEISNIQVAPDIIPPVAYANIEKFINEEANIEVTIKDLGGSGLKKYKYAVTTEDNIEEENLDWSDEMLIFSTDDLVQQTTQNIRFNDLGDHYIYIQAEDNAGNQRTIKLGKFIIEEKKINVTLEKVDNQNQNIKLPDAKLKLIELQPPTNASTTEPIENIATTDENGQAFTNIFARRLATYNYRIEELDAPVGYNTINPADFEITYDNNGDVQSINCLSNDLSSIVEDGENIKIIVRDTKKETSSYDFLVEAIDKENTNKKISGIKFRIEMDADSGETIELEQETNENGQISIPKLATIGETRITIIPMGPIDEYKCETIPQYLSFNRNANGQIIGVPSKTSDDIEASIQDNKLVKVTVPFERKQEQNRITLEVLEGEDSAFEGVEFNLKDEYGIIDVTDVTDENGIINFDNIPCLGAGDFIFTLTPADGSINGLGPIKVVVTFDRNDRIVSIQEITTYSSETKVIVTEDEQNIYNTGYIKINTVGDTSSQNQKLKIIKVDQNNVNKKLPGVTYKIKQATDSAIKTTKKATDSFGEIDVNLMNANTNEITIKELRSISGYKYNNEEKTIKLRRNQMTGKMEVVQNGTSSNLNIEVENNGNIIVTETNERKVDSTSGGKANISFFLTKYDKLGNKLGNVQFTLIETTTGRTFNLVTDENGYVELPNFDVPDEGIYEFFLTEANTVVGYDVATAPIQLTISYENYEGEMKTTQIVVSRGYKYIKYKKCDEYETQDTYQLDVIMDIINEANPIGKINTIEVVKEGEGAEILNKAKYEFVVSYEDGTTIKQETYADKIHEMLNEVKFPEGEDVTITLRETEAPVGYELDEQARIIVITNDNGTLRVKSSNAKSAKVLENGNIQIKLSDRKKPMDGVISTPTDPTWNDPGYNIRIINNNAYNDKLKLEGSVFEAKVEKDNAIVYKAYRSLGRSYGTHTFNRVGEFNAIRVDGEQQISLRQTKAPLHHVINDEVYTLDIQRNARNGTITLVNKSNPNLDVTIDNDKRLITVVITNRPAELIMAINKVDAQDRTIGLANVGFAIGKYIDTSAADLRTKGYIKTDIYGTGYTTLNTYQTNSTITYYIDETNPPEGYYRNGNIGLSITTDQNGNISKANVINNSGVFDKNKCEIDRIEDNYIELTIINNRKPEPTYSVVIVNKNMHDTVTKVNGSVFNVQIQQDVGPDINCNVTTNVYGIAAVNGLTGKENLKIRVEQVAPGTSYKKNDTIFNVEAYRTFMNTVSSNGNIYYENIDFIGKNPIETNVRIDNEKKQIIIEVLNERVHGLEIIKKAYVEDEKGCVSTIFLPDAKFELFDGDNKLGETVTDINGRGFIPLGDAPIDITKEYTLKETVPPPGWTKITDKTVTMRYDESGKIRYAEIKENDIESIKIQGNNYVQAVIVEPGQDQENPQEGKPQETFSELEIIKENYNNKKLKIENVTFRITTEAEDGRKITAIRKTDERGRINLYGIPGNRIEIKLTEIETANGFYLDDQERKIVVEKRNDKLYLVEDESADDIEIQVDERTRKVKVFIKNKIDNNYMALALVKEDAEDELLTIEGATYEIKDMETSDIYTLTTGEEGMGIAFIEAKKQAGTYRFMVRETKAPEGYELKEDTFTLEVEVKLDEAGKSYIETARIVEDVDFVDIQNQDKNYVEMHFRNEALEGPEAYNIKVVKVDRDDIQIKLPDATLKIDVQNSIGQTGLSKTDVTDSEGKIMINNIRGAGNVQIDIEELVPPPFRKFDLKPKQALLTKDPTTGRLKLIDSTNVDTIISNKEKLITILVRNEIIDGYYTVVLEKKDYNNKDLSLTNVKMKVEIPGEAEPREVVSNKDGRIVLMNLPMPSEGVLKLKITELETIDGYKKLDKPIELSITFKQEYETESITDAKITENAEHAKVLEVLPKYVRAAIYNEKDYFNDKYKVTLIKKDGTDNSVLANTKIRMEVNYEDGSGVVIETYTDENGRICIDDLTTTGITNIVVQEIEAPEGYELDPEVKTVKCNIESPENIELQEKEGNIEVNIKNREIELVLTNERSEDFIKMHLEKFITKINSKTIENEPQVTITDNQITYSKTSEKQTVKPQDLVEYTLRVYNEGTKSGYASKIVEKVPEGLEYVEDNEVNIANGWTKVSDNEYVTDILSMKHGKVNLIEGYDELAGLKYKDVKIVFRVVEKQDKNATTTNIATIDEYEDVEGNPKPPTGHVIPDPGSDEFEIEYVKYEIDKKVTKISLIENGVVKAKEVNANGASKVEIEKSKMNKTYVEVEYQITITNNGTKIAKPGSIIDYLPEGMEVVLDKSSGWTSGGRYELNQELKPGDTITKTITLRCKASSTGAKINTASVEDVFSPEAIVIISTKTGQVPVYAGLALVVSAIVGSGTYIIRKKILFI